MSQANVDVVRAVLAQWNRGETGAREHFHPDVEWLPLRAATEGAYIESGGVFELRDGKIVRWEDFGSKAAALEAAEAGDR